MKKSSIIISFLCCTIFTAFGQENGLKENLAINPNQQTKECLALIKQNFSQSENSIKKYSWIETTTVFSNGEQKSEMKQKCYFDATGTLIKVDIDKNENKSNVLADSKDEMQVYVEKAKTIMKAYIPIKYGKLEEIYAAGDVKIKVLDEDMKYELYYPDYLKKGDLVSIVANISNKILMDYNVKTYIDTPSDAVTLDVAFQNLPDWSSYSGSITFISPSKNLKVVTVNSGYKLAAGN